MRPLVLIGIDGLRPEALGRAHCLTLTGLRERGACTLRASSVMPSVSLPCWMSVFHGVPPSRHGVITNDWMPMADPLPGLVELASAAGLRCGSLFNWGPIRDVTRPSSLAFSCFRNNLDDHRNGDQEIADQAAQYFLADHPDFMFVYLGVLDEVAHVVRFMSDEYLRQVERVDATVGTLIHALPPDATILVVSDHGGHDHSHGDDVPEDMTVPWIIAGPGIRRHHEIEARVSIIDTAPTAARVLGLTPPPGWEGRAVDEVFV